jgi:hypothetical protein
LTEFADVIDDLRCEQLVQAIEFALVEEVTVHRDDVSDRKSVVTRECHAHRLRLAERNNER